MDILLERETYILLSDNEDITYPADDLYPNEDMYPSAPTRLDNIVAGSMSLSEILCEGAIQFGQIYSTRFECTLYQTDEMEALGDFSGKHIKVVQYEDDKYNVVFTGIVDSCKTDRLGYDKKVIAYDPAYSLGYVNVADWWNHTFWSDGMRSQCVLYQMRQSLLEYMGIKYIDKNLANDWLVIKKIANINVTSISFCAMLKMICELSCCFPHFNRDGKLEFIVLNESSAYDIEDSLYEVENSDFEEYTSKPYTGIQLYTSNSTVIYSYGEMDNVYSVSDNLLIYGMEENYYESLSSEMLRAMEMFVYRPSSVKMIVSDWRYKLGDYVITPKGFFYIFELDFSGSQLVEQTLSAKGVATSDQVGVDVEVVETVMEDVVSELDDEVNDLYDEVDEVGDEVDQLISELDEVKRHIEADNEHLRITFAEVTGQDVWFTHGVIHSEKYYKDVEAGVDPPDTSQDILGAVERYNIQTNLYMDYGEPTATLGEVVTTWSNQGLEIYEELDTIPTAEDKDSQGEYIYDHTVPTSEDENYDNGKYYMVAGTGDIYQYQVTPQLHTSTKVTGKTNKTPTAVYNMLLVKKGVAESTDYGWNIFPSEAELDDYYLDEETGKIYHLEGTSANMHWVYKYDCPSTKLIHETAFNQDAHSLVLEANARAAEDTLMSGRIEVAAHEITLETTGAGQSASLVIHLLDEKGRPLPNDKGNIELTGLVKFTDLSGTSSTFINGGNIQTQTIDVLTIKPNLTLNNEEVIQFENSYSMPGAISGRYLIGGELPVTHQHIMSIEGDTITIGNNNAHVLSKSTVELGYGYHDSYTSGYSYEDTFGPDLGGNGQYWHSGAEIHCMSPFFYKPFPYLRSDSSAANIRCQHGSYGINDTYRFAPISQSSRRWKHDIRPIEDENLDPHKLYDLPVSQFIYNLSYLGEDDQRYNTPIPGFIAEDVANKYPIAADLDSDGQANDWNVRYIVPPMLKLIQEQNDRITALEEQIKQLQETVNKLQKED